MTASASAKGSNASRDRAKRRRSNYAWHLKHYFGVTIEWYEEQFAKQDGRCRICLRRSATRLHVDHDHSCCPGRKSCGKCLRGLICGECNFRLLGRICQEQSMGTRHAVEVLYRAILHLSMGAGWDGHIVAHWEGEAGDGAESADDAA
jgi:hypothetical protein